MSSVVLRALLHRNYRSFFFAQGISLIGTWMQQVSMTWLVYHFTQSEWKLGLVAFAGQIPTFFLSPFAGVLTDRWNRKKILILTQTLAMSEAFLVSGLTYFRLINVDQILVLAVSLGIVNAFDMTTRQAFLSDMVTRKEDLPNAVALNSSLVNCTRLIGPALAGIVITLGGEAFCFLLNGFSYIAVICVLVKMNVHQTKKTFGKHEALLLSLKEGLIYAYHSQPIRAILLLLSVTSITSVSLTTLLPAFAAMILSDGAQSFSILSAVSGAGALTGAIYLTSRKNMLGLSQVICSSTFLLGVSMLCFSYSHFRILSFVCLFMIGAGNITQMAASNSLLQVIADEGKRGRVLSLYIVALLGMAPLGSLLSGFFGDKFGAPATVRFTGILTIISAFVFYHQVPRIRALVMHIHSPEKNENNALEIEKGNRENSPQREKNEGALET